MAELRVYNSLLVEMFNAANNVYWKDNWITCNDCEGWLTQPIFIHNDNKHYCQTCSLKKGNGYRIEAWESILQKCLYPCHYEYCFAWLPFEEIQNHEQNCKWSHVISCWFCTITFNFENDYLNHLLNQHSEQCKTIKISTPKIQLTLHPNTSNIVAAKYKFNTFMIYTRNTNEGFWVCITKDPFVNEEDTHEFNLKLTSAGTDQIHNFKGQCIDANLFRKDSSFTMVESKMQEESEVTLTFSKCDSNIKTAECPICFHPMAGTIVICGNGHAVCEDCGSKIVNCAVCRTTMNGTRLKLSSIIPNIQLPCEYADMGCLKLETADTIETHSTTCGYRPINCWDCNKNISKNVIYSHFQKDHILKSKTISSYIYLVYLQNENNPEICYTSCNDNIFRLKYKYTPNDNISFLVQVMNDDDANIEENYKYKILFSKGDITLSNLILKGKCQSRTQDKITSVLTIQEYEHLLEQQFSWLNFFVYPVFNK